MSITDGKEETITLDDALLLRLEISHPGLVPFLRKHNITRAIKVDNHKGQRFLLKFPGTSQDDGCFFDRVMNDDYMGAVVMDRDSVQ